MPGNVRIRGSINNRICAVTLHLLIVIYDRGVWFHCDTRAAYAITNVLEKWYWFIFIQKSKFNWPRYFENLFNDGTANNIGR